MTLTSNPSGAMAEDILSFMGNAVFLVGHDDIVVHANQHLADLFDLDPERLVGRPYSFLFTQLAAKSSDSNGALKSLVAAFDRVNHYPNGEFVAGQSSPRHLQFTLFPLPDNHNGASWGGVIHDVSFDQGRSNQRTKIFLNLIDELRSSLVFIIGCASTLLSDHYSWSKEELDGFLQTINANAQDTIQLLENVRDISRLDIKELDLRSRPTNLKRLVQYVAQKLAEEGSYLELKLDVADDLPMVDVDAIRLSRALHNLIASILKLSFGTRIELSAQQVDNKIQIDIGYYGNGLPDLLRTEDIDELLQERNHNPQMVRDLGLRLYFAQGIIQAHDGHMWTEESKEQQVVVHITLPLRGHVVSTPPANDSDQQADSRTGRSSKANATVLVIEQDGRVSQQLKNQLGSEGYHVVMTHEGEAGLDLAAIEVPDVILLSYYLPDTDALTICQKLREQTAAPIIMLAASSEEDTIIQSLNAGADDYIVKPLRPKELLARIQANLRRAFLSDITDRSSGKTSLEVGDLTIDFVQRKVMRGDEIVNLTPIEYKLLHNLAVNAGRILTHEQLVTKVWGPIFQQETQYLWVNISRLRAKIEEDPGNPQYILTERGVGYTFYNPDDDRGRIDSPRKSSRTRI